MLLLQSGGGIGETLLDYRGEVKETHTGSNPVLTAKNKNYGRKTNRMGKRIY